MGQIQLIAMILALPMTETTINKQHWPQELQRFLHYVQFNSSSDRPQFSAKCQCTIELDQNRFRIIFEVRVFENLSPNTQLLLLSHFPCKMNRSCLTKNQEKFEFCKQNDHFYELKTLVPLDRETDETHQIELCSKTLAVVAARVTVLDLNDNEPKCENHEFFVEENARIGTVVGKVLVSDKDKTSQFHFELEANQHFSIHPSSGELIVLKSPDYELNRRFLLRITVSDSRKSPLLGYCVVSLTIANLNDNPSRICVENDTLLVRESAEIGSKVALVSVKDPDFPETVELRAESDAFDVRPTADPFVFELFLSRKLDRESRSVHFVNLAIPNEDELEIRVLVEDENDNPPVFAFGSQTLKLHRSQIEQFRVLVKADDADEGENGIIEYFLAEAPDFVAINSTSGEIRLLPSTAEDTSFWVVAKDKGIPSLEAKCRVEIRFDEEAEIYSDYSFEIFPTNVHDHELIWAAFETVIDDIFGPNCTIPKPVSQQQDLLVFSCDKLFRIVVHRPNRIPTFNQLLSTKSEFVFITPSKSPNNLIVKQIPLKSTIVSCETQLRKCPVFLNQIGQLFTNQTSTAYFARFKIDKVSMAVKTFNIKTDEIGEMMKKSNLNHQHTWIIMPIIFASSLVCLIAIVIGFVVAINRSSSPQLVIKMYS